VSSKNQAGSSGWPGGWSCVGRVRLSIAWEIIVFSAGDFW